MRNIHAALAAAAMLAIPLAARCAQTQPATPMTLQQATAFALAHNVSVLAAQAAVDSAGATLARDRSQTLPTVNGELSSTLNKQSGNAGSFAQIGVTPSQTFSQNTASLRGAYNAVNVAALLTAREDRHSYDAAAGKLRQAREQTTLDVETSYYTLIENAQLADIATGDAAYNKALLDAAAVNFKAGKVAGIDQLKAEVQYNTSLEHLASAQADLEDSRENLAQTVGAPVEQQFAVLPGIPAPPLPNLDTATLDAIALTDRPDVAIAQAQLDIARLAPGLVEAPNLPIVTVGGQWGNQISPTENALLFNACVAHGLPASACGPGASHFYTIGINSTWSVPLLDWGARNAGHKSAGTGISSQAAALDAAQRQAVIDVDQAARRVKVNQQNLQLALGNVGVAKQTADIAREQYTVGIISELDVTNAQQTYLQAAKDLLAAQVGYVLSIEKLKLATGTL